jgi:hypothetical protein
VTGGGGGLAYLSSCLPTCAYRCLETLRVSDGSWGAPRNVSFLNVCHSSRRVASEKPAHEFKGSRVHSNIPATSFESPRQSEFRHGALMSPKCRFWRCFIYQSSSGHCPISRAIVMSQKQRRGGERREVETARLDEKRPLVSGILSLWHLANGCSVKKNSALTHNIELVISASSNRI